MGIGFIFESTKIIIYSGSRKSEVCPMPYALCPMPYALCPTVLVLAEQEGWTEAQYLEQFQTLGIDQKPNCPLGSFAHTYFEKKV
jgi:hypothetical protein